MKFGYTLLFISLFTINSIFAQTLIYEDLFSSSGDGTNISTTAFSSGSAPNNTNWRYTEFDTGWGVSWEIVSGEARLQNEYGVNHDYGANLLYKAGDGYYTAPGGLYEQSASFTTTFANNSEILEWSFNFYANAQPTGMTNGGAGFLGGAFVLGLSSPTLQSCTYTTEGYAVIFGDASGSGNYVKLVRVEGGTTDGNCAVNNQPKYTFFNWNGTNTTTCIISDDQIVQGSVWYSVKVQYNPADDEWRLYVRNDGGTKGDPQTLDATHCKGANIDGNYTNVNLPIMGLYSCQPDVSPYRYVEFDNIRIKSMPSMLGCNSTTGLCGAYAPCSTPSLTLSSTIGNYCVNSTINITGNTFINSSGVNITHDGAGSITPSSVTSSPFGFTYTPDPGDQGNTVTVTVETVDLGCGVQTENYTINFYNAPDVDPILSANATTVCESSGVLDLTGFEVGTTGGTWSGTGVVGTDFDPSAGSQTLTYTVGTAPCEESSDIAITVVALSDPSLTTNGIDVCEADGLLDLTVFEAGTTGGTWSGTGVTGTDFDPSLGTQTLTYTVGVSPCDDSETITINVTADVDPSLTSSTTSVCASGGLLDLTAFEAGTTGGTWTGIGVTGTDFDPASGSQTVTYTVGTSPCEESSDLAITVVTVPDPSLTTTSTDVCEAAGLVDLMAFEAGTTGGTWSGTGVTGTDFDPSSGTQTLTYTVGVSPCDDSETITINVTADVDATLSGTPSTVCESQGLIDLTMYELGTTGGTWSGVGVTGTDFDPTSGTQTLTYTVGTAPCEESADITITVLTTVDASLSMGSTTVCDGAGLLDLTTFEAGTTGGTWSGTGVTGTDFDPAVGTQILTYTVGASPCLDTDMITINVVPSSDATLSDDTLRICDDIGLVDLTVYEQGTPGGTWFGVGVTGTEFNPSIGSQWVTYLVGTIPCEASDSIYFEVTTVPSSPLTFDTLVCITDSSVVLTAQGGSGEIIWYSDSLLQQPIDTGSVITYPYTTTGLNEIYLQETLNGCLGDTGVVSVDVGSITVGIITDPAIPTGEAPFEVEFDGYDPSIDSYTWDIEDGTIYADSIVVHTFTSSGEYINILVGSNDYCTTSDTVIITVTEGESWFVIPNVFTPNFDEENDVFRVSGSGLEIVKGQIYNRWGQLMYKWDTIYGGWDGRTTAGEEASEGTYYYIIEIKTITMGEQETFTGPLQLIR